jgi:transcriptional regulator with XRE-family HTH domain
VPGIGHYEAIRKEIIRLLQKERERRKLSNYAVSQRSGVSESMLSLVERGFRNPTMELMLRIADGIGVNLSTFIEKGTQTIIQGKDNKPARKGRRKAGTQLKGLRDTAIPPKTR